MTPRVRLRLTLRLNEGDTFSHWIAQKHHRDSIPPEHHWLELQDSLNRWGSSNSWKRYEQLGAIARANQ